MQETDAHKGDQTARKTAAAGGGAELLPFGSAVRPLQYSSSSFLRFLFGVAVIRLLHA